MKKNLKKFLKILLFIQLFFKFDVYAQSIPNVSINFSNPNNPNQVNPTLQVLFLISIIGLLPSLLLMMTSFTRIIITLSFMRSALGTQQMPPTQILVGIALFISLFLMGPIFGKINDNAIKPFSEGKINQEVALKEGMEPLREFMFKQVEVKDMALFSNLAKETYESREEIPNRVLIPAFILGELTKGFKFGFLIFMPFIVIDLVVASTLMAMGMMMLPPAMIALPFKILLFIMVDGWSLLIENLIMTFRF